ncbi:MAG: acyltransferase [Acutalibacteraceae bacterium]|nr:acyltransferase [Acutalibacteraceae bacterium]
MRNKLLDQIRFFAALSVVLIHTPFPGVLGQGFEAVARIAVPIFFMVSGFYAFGKSKEKLLKSAKKTAILLLWSVGLYFVWGVLWSFYKGNTADYLKNYFSLNSLVETVALNNGIILGHLWFLLALLYCYLLYTFLLRKAPDFIQVGLSSVLFVGFFVARELLKWGGVEDPVYYLRNYLFVGIPYFLCGMLINKYREKILNVPISAFMVAFCIGLVLSIIERFTIGCSDLYVGTPIAVIALFSLTLNPNLKSNENLSKLGKLYAGDIYIFHMLIITIVNVAASVVGILNLTLFPWVRPFIVIAISLSVAVIVVYIRNNILTRCKKRKF